MKQVAVDFPDLVINDKKITNILSCPLNYLCLLVRVLEKITFFTLIELFSA